MMDQPASSTHAYARLSPQVGTR